MNNGVSKIIIKKLNQDNLKALESFVFKNASKGGAEFLQSSLWQKILQAEGKNTSGFFIYQNEEIIASLLITRKSFAKFFSYFYAPRGPIFKVGLSISKRDAVLLALKKYFSANYRCLFLRFEPIEIDFSLPLVKSIDLQPQKTLLLDLRQDENELLSAMHQKTRYNIRLAAKKNLHFCEASKPDVKTFDSDFSDFWRLMQKTASRDVFGIHGKNHYRNLLISGHPNVKLYFVEHEGQRIAAGIFSFFGNKATYLHGASDDQYKNLMAPYLLQFEVIKIAKKAGFFLYDFYGIDEKKWPGVTRFKNGFGGFSFSYAGTYDLPFNKTLYSFYLILRKLRRLF